MKKQKHIMQIVHSLNCGGLERLAIDMAAELNARDYNASICCLDDAGELADDAKAKGVRVIVAGKRKGADLSLPLKLAKILRKEKVDVVHTHNMGPLVYGTLAAKLARIPVIVNTRHGREKKQTYSFLWKMNDCVVAISEDARRRLLVFNRLDYGKSKVIYNGIRATKPAKIDAQTIKEKIFKIDPKCKVVGTISRLSEEKDQTTLINAFAKVTEAVKDARLVFVGDGPLKKELEEHSKKLGTAGKVIFLGFRTDATDIVEAFDIFVLPSLTEGISLGLLEAMAAGKPAVATDVGGNPEVIIDEVTGFLVQAQAKEELADALIKLLRNDGLSKKMGEAGRMRMNEKFTIGRMVDEYKNLYETLLADKGLKA